jgi:hypothetical protein
VKIYIRLVLLFSFAFLVSGCAGNSAANATPTSLVAPTEPPATEFPATESPVVDDKESFIAALEASGATVETGESISQPFFTPEGSVIKVNGADVQVFEYESAEAMDSEASQVAPDGSSVGTSMMNWVDTPHFYKADRIIVLYVGSDETVLELLQKTVGNQFAGG